MAESVHKTGNGVLIDTYAQKTALRLGVSPESVRTEFKKNPAPRTGPIADEEEGSFESAESLEAPRSSSLEFHLLKLLLLHDELVGATALHLDLNWIQNPLVRQIVGQRLAAQANENWQSLAAFLDGCESPEARSLVTEAVAEERKIPNPELQLADVVLKLRNQFFDRQIATFTQKASQPQIGDAEKNELLCERQKLRDHKRTPLSPLQN